jgi:hypothetical protein
MRLPIDFSDVEQGSGALYSLAAHLRRIWPSSCAVSVFTTRGLLIKAFGYESLRQMKMSAKDLKTSSFKSPELGHLVSNVITTVGRYLTVRGDTSCTAADVINAVSALDFNSLKCISISNTGLIPKINNHATPAIQHAPIVTATLTATEIESITIVVSKLNLARDSLLLQALKSGLQPADILSLRVSDSHSVCASSDSYDRLPFELLVAMEHYIKSTKKKPGQFILSASPNSERPLASRTFARIFSKWAREALPHRPLTTINTFCLSLAKQRFYAIGKALG